MDAFCQLFARLDGTTRTNEKVTALVDYFRAAPPADAAWALFFLSGRRLPSVVSAPQLREWAGALAGLPRWLMDEAYATAGDLAETLALVLPPTFADDAWQALRAVAATPTKPSVPTADLLFAAAAMAPATAAASPAPPAPSDAVAFAGRPGRAATSLAEVVETVLRPLAELPPLAQAELLAATWQALGESERLVFNKLVTGAFRVGVSRTLLERALAEVAGVPQAVLAHRLMGDWQPTPAELARLLAPPAPAAEHSAPHEVAQPYPFALAHPLEGPVEALGAAPAWQAEWKWDGIRAQLLHRQAEVFLWSRGEEMVTARFPEIAEGARHLPNGTVLDGEILAWQGDAPLPFAVLQTRLGRKEVSAAVRAAAPVCFVAYDVLEAAGRDLRAQPLVERRAVLTALVAATAPPKPSARVTPPRADQLDLFASAAAAVEVSAAPPAALSPRAEAAWLRLSPVLAVGSGGWAALVEHRAQARARGVEGLMLKRLASPYPNGRQRGDWWKWKVDPFTIDAVLVAAQAGHGRRAGLFTDYTFALWTAAPPATPPGPGAPMPPLPPLLGSALTDEALAEVTAVAAATEGVALPEATNKGGPAPTLVAVAKAYSGLNDDEIVALDRWIQRHTRQKFGPMRFVDPLLVFELAFEQVQASTRHKGGLAVRFPRILRWRHDKTAPQADTLDLLRRWLPGAPVAAPGKISPPG